MLHSKQWQYSLHRDFQNCYSTRRSPTGFFSSNSTRVPIHHISYNLCAHYMHPENSPSRIQFYMQKTKSSSSTTIITYRRQIDLHSRKEILCIEGKEAFQAFQPQDLPKAFQIPDIPVFPDIPDIPDLPVILDIPVIHDLPAFQVILQVPVSPGNPPHFSILRLECIFYIFYKFYSLIGFHRNSTEYQSDNYKLQTLHSSKKGRCCNIGQNTYW